MYISKQERESLSKREGERDRISYFNLMKFNEMSIGERKKFFPLFAPGLPTDVNLSSAAL